MKKNFKKLTKICASRVSTRYAISRAAHSIIPKPLDYRELTEKTPSTLLLLFEALVFLRLLALYRVSQKNRTRINNYVYINISVNLNNALINS